MTRRGRRPLATGHVERLSGSALAKLRLQAILKTLRGEWTVLEACQRLGVGESRFHALRQQWLQEALELLEPRPVGRPRKASPASMDEREAEVEQLRAQLHLADVRRQIEAVLPGVTMAAGKKRRQAARDRPR